MDQWDSITIGTSDSHFTNIVVDPANTTLLKSGESTRCRCVESPNSRYLLAVSEGIFVFENNMLCFDTELSKPDHGGIANDGTTAIINSGFHDPDSDGYDELHVFDTTGSLCLHREITASVMTCAIDPTGTYVAIGTVPADQNSIYLFNTTTGDVEAWHRADVDLVTNLQFVDVDGKLALEICDHPDREPAYRIDTSASLLSEQDSPSNRLTVDIDDLLEAATGSTTDILALIELSNIAASTPGAYERRHVKQILEAVCSGNFESLDDDPAHAKLIIGELAMNEPELVLPFIDRLVSMLTHERDLAKRTGGSGLLGLVRYRPVKMEPHLDSIESVANENDGVAHKEAKRVLGSAK